MTIFQMNDITFYNDPEGRFIPPHEIEEPETRLKEFKWQIERKPSKSDVLGKYGENKNVIEVEENTVLPKETILFKEKRAKYVRRQKNNRAR